ncbi:MAG: hypothetical protein AAF191_20710 [Verrucomicrobiota bacterium]
MSSGSLNPYQAPQSLSPPVGEQNVDPRTLWLSTMLALSGIHSSSVLIPVSLWQPSGVLYWMTGGSVRLEQGSDDRIWVPVFWIIVYVLSLVVLFLLLHRWKFRNRLFYIGALGTTITMAFCCFVGAVWNLIVMIVIWVQFGRRTSEFFPSKGHA